MLSLIRTYGLDLKWIIESATPYIVLILTLYFTKRNLNIQLKNNNESFEKQYNLQKTNFDSQLTESKETTRLSIMPYLVLLRNNVSFSFRENNKDLVDIELKFINKGTGTATNVLCKYLSNSNNAYTGLVSKTLTYEYYIATPFDWYGNIAMTNENLKMKLMFEPKKVLFDTREAILSDQFNFIVLFKDVQGRQYRQEFLIQFHLCGCIYEPLLIETYSPCLDISM